MKRHAGLAGRVSSGEVPYTVPVEPGVEFSSHQCMHCPGRPLSPGVMTYGVAEAESMTEFNLEPPPSQGVRSLGG